MRSFGMKMSSLISAKLISWCQRVKQSFITISLLTVSALFLHGAMANPHSYAFFVFLFLIPIFICALGQGYVLNYRHGYYWGLLFFVFHSNWLFSLVHERARGQWRMIIPLVLILYMALYPLLWFGTATSLASRVKNLSTKAIIWALVTWGYFMTMRNASLWISGNVYGYCFALPLLPLAHYPPFLHLLPFIGSSLLLLSLICFALAMSHAYSHSSWCSLFISIFFLLPFIYGWFMPSSQETSSLPEKIAYAQPPKDAYYPGDYAQMLHTNISNAFEKKSTATCVIMPESSFPFPLNKHEDILKLWQKQTLENTQLLILGSHKEEGGKLYNCLYCVDHSCISMDYVKNIRMPFTEYIPWPWCYCEFLQKLFLKESKGFTQRNNVQRTFILNNTIIQPVICSEFFLGPLHGDPKTMLLCIVNDSWFEESMRDLMVLFARYTAIENQRPIIYISHSHGLFIKRNGSFITL